MSADSSHKKRNWSVILLLLFLILIFGFLVFVWREVYIPEEPGSTQWIVFSIKKGFFAVVIESDDIANSYRAMFEMAWQAAEKVK